MAEGITSIEFLGSVKSTGDTCLDVIHVILSSWKANACEPSGSKTMRRAGRGLAVGQP